MDTTNLRIVCIIQNDQNESDKGLVHAFEHERQGQLNYFIKTHLYQFEDEHFRTSFGYDKKPKFLLITKESVQPKNELNTNDSWEILFICDTISIEDYPSYIFTPETLLMYHTKPKIDDNPIYEIRIKIKKEASSDGVNIEPAIYEIRKIKKGKKGEHEPGKEKGYNLLLKLTDAWENETIGFNNEKYAAAKKEIIDWFGINDELEQKLELLHKCLTPEDAASCIVDTENNWNLIETFSLLSNIKIDKLSVSDYIKNSFVDKSDCFDEENYIEPLRKLRKALLQ